MKRILYLFLILMTYIWASDQIPAAPQTKPILIKHGTLHTVSHGVLDGFDLLFERGLITRIEKDIAPTAEMEIIDACGLHIYPGLIAGVSALGLVEISAVRATLDYDEVGDITPEVRANVSYNPDSESIPVTRSNGVLFVNVVPRGGLVPGQSSLMMMDGWTWENATVQHPTAMHINWPDMSIDLSPKAKVKASTQEEKRRQRLKDLDDTIDQVRRYEVSQKGASKTSAHDLRMEALIPYIRGEKPFFVHASESRQIEAAVRWSKRQGLKVVIVGGGDVGQLAGLLKENHIPVVVEGTLKLPRRRNSNYTESYDLPARLYEAGVNFCISTDGSGFAAPQVRDLPNHAAMAAAFGLPTEVALRAITLSAAEILGVGDRIGSLDVGKEASLFIASGDILEITSLVEQAFIHGTKTDMNDRHKTLYKKYEEKYKQLGSVKEK
ncbi:MAG: amidohydrolase family protein [Candidatus Marinimicrobia bacterium]|nr:amidohydrolase family protein [FCB group bacterium]MBL7023939.1 amidohydrolase family protein [Candidatus Neomarinimicrobiota bacterium]